MEETLCDSVYDSVSESHLDSRYRISDDSESNENGKPRTMTIKSHYTGYVVYWFCISILFKYCLSGGCLANVLNVCTRGSMLIVELLCYKLYKNIWRSEQVIDRYALGDLRLAASTLYCLAQCKIRSIF